MSNLARYFKNLGKQVCGYDKTPSALTNELIESGISIPGANILLKGSNTGTTTTNNGTFKLETPNQSGVLVISSIGFQTKEVAFAATTSVINIKLAQDIKSLGEVVVTA